MNNSSTTLTAVGQKLSVIIITKNESKNIADCLQSVDFADEIIVLDSGSDDDTCAIARTHHAKVYENKEWPGFGPQKNMALGYATGDWVLSIDADERVTPELKQAILDVLKQQANGALVSDGYRIARLSMFCGRWIRHSGWWPDYVVRLFKRESGKFTDVAVHEQVVIQGATGTINKGHFLHYPYENLEALINKLNSYSTAAAKLAVARGKRTTVLGIFGHAFWTFIRIYILRKGFLDGWQGLVLAGMASSGSFFRYAKIYWLRKQSKQN